MQREVYGHTRKDVLDVLYKSQKQMIEGFVGLLANRIPEPFFLFDKLLEDIVDERNRIVPPRKAPTTKKKKKVTRMQRKRMEKTMREESIKGESIKLVKDVSLLSLFSHFFSSLLGLPLNQRYAFCCWFHQYREKHDC